MISSPSRWSSDTTVVGVVETTSGTLGIIHGPSGNALTLERDDGVGSGSAGTRGVISSSLFTNQRDADPEIYALRALIAGLPSGWLWFPGASPAVSSLSALSASEAPIHSSC